MSSAFFVLSFCFVIFFFKQKTAYEMRISDWSSDVCSSDLSPTGRTLAVKGDTFKQKSSAVEYRERDDGTLSETRILTDKFVPVIRAWDQIGRASCRARVCQYV